MQLRLVSNVGKNAAARNESEHEQATGNSHPEVDHPGSVWIVWFRKLRQMHGMGNEKFENRASLHRRHSRCKCDARTSFPLGTSALIGIIVTSAEGKRKQKMIFDRIVNVDGKD